MAFNSLKQLYNGFTLSTPTGNNAFSFDQRQKKDVYVPPLIEGGWDNVRPGNQTVFIECVNGEEKHFCGLDKLVYIPHQGKHIFVFDNHNHAFCFWMAAYQQGWMKAGMRLVHVDQHKDTRKPLTWLEESLDEISLGQAFIYTQRSLNVGNFIPPALRCGLLRDVHMMVGAQDFEQLPEPPFILDIDMDIFAPDMAYLPDEIKIEALRTLIDQANVITIATSPFFIDQTYAVDMLKHVFDV